MDNHQVIELFIHRGMVDRSLAQDVLAEIDNSGKEIGEVLTDFEIIHSRDDMWPVVASELGADLVELRNWTPPLASVTSSDLPSRRSARMNNG